MKTLGKKLSVLLSAALCLALLAGSLGTLAQEEVRWSPEKPISIRFAALVDMEREWTAYQKVVEAYKEVQPNVQVELVQMQWEDARTWQTMQLMGGTMPEVFRSKLSWAVEDYNKGQIMALNDLFAAPNPYTDTPTMEDFYADNVIDQLLASCKDFIAVCNHVSVVKTFYNKDIFDAAGVEQLPTTWNEFMEVCQKIQDAGYVPFAFANSKPADNLYNWCERLLTYQLIEEIISQIDLNGSDSIEANEFCYGIDQGLIDITQEPYCQVFPMIKEWSQYWSRGYNAIDSETAQQMFIRGEAAMYLGFPTLVQDMQDMGVELNYGVFSFPMLTKENSQYACEKYYEMGGNVTEVYCIPSTASGEKLEAAQDFLYFLSSPAAMKILADEAAYMPTAKDASLISESLKGWEPVGNTVRMNIYGPAIDQRFSDDTVMFGQLYLEGAITIEEYLSEMQTSLLDMCERLKQTNGWSPENNYGLDA